MSFFSSRRERRLWLALAIVLAAIYATMAHAPAIAAFLRERNSLTATMFLLFLVSLVVISILFVSRRPGRAEIAAGAGILIVYLMAWLRIGVATPEERTHLFEYSLVAALVHEALLERRENGRHVPAPAILALIISILLGWLDEGMQSLLPGRVYDIMDVAFNALAATMIIGARCLLAFLRRRVQARRDGV
ncbi:MAG: VanZ family protein [Anaerolineae bacterium]|nr:VanZ family protein [Anaerolineae bacterium]